MGNEHISEWFYVWVRKNVYNNHDNNRFFNYDNAIFNKSEEIASKILKINSKKEEDFYKKYKINNHKEAIFIEGQALKKVLIEQNADPIIIKKIDKIIQELMEFKEEDLSSKMVKSYKRRIIEVEILSGFNTNFSATLKSMLVSEYTNVRKMVQNGKNYKSL